MRKSLTAVEVRQISAIQDRIDALRERYYFNNEAQNVALNHGNGSVLEQLGCASAALECILQEY